MKEKNFFQHMLISKKVKEPEKLDDKKLFNRFTSTISGIFMPILGLLCASGIIKGVLVLFTSLNWLDNSSTTYVIINAVGNALFYFFPVVVGCSAAEKFGLNKYIGIILGAILVYPDLIALSKAEPIYTLFTGTPIESNVTATLFGIPIVLMDYSNSVIPVIIATFIGAKIQSVLKKHVPQAIKMFTVPAITLLLTTIITLLLFGPIATWMAQIIGWILLTLRNVSPVLVGALVGGFWQCVVIMGLNEAMTPIIITNFMTMGYDNVFVPMQIVCFATFGVVMAIYLKSKNIKVRGIALPGAISCLFGISGPALWGLTLPLKKPFYVTCISSALSGIVLAIFNTKGYTIGGRGIFSFPSYINPNGGFDLGFYGFIVASIVAVVTGFILTWLFGFKEEDYAKLETK